MGPRNDIRMPGLYSYAKQLHRDIFDVAHMQAKDHGCQTCLWQWPPGRTWDCAGKCAHDKFTRATITYADHLAFSPA